MTQVAVDFRAASVEDLAAKINRFLAEAQAPGKGAPCVVQLAMVEYGHGVAAIAIVES